MTFYERRTQAELRRPVELGLAALIGMMKSIVNSRPLLRRWPRAGPPVP